MSGVMLSNIGVIGHILGLYRNNGKEHGSYYSILGLYFDNGFKGFWGIARAKKNFIWVSAVGSGFRACGRDALYAIPCQGEGFIISFAGPLSYRASAQEVSLRRIFKILPHFLEELYF